MTQQQRNDYIAEKILGANKKIQHDKTWLYVPGKEFEPPFEWEFPDGRIVNSKTDFESLPEWVGPICEVVFPLLAEENWNISFLYNGYVSLVDSEGWAIVDIRIGPLSTVLVNAHIKISEE
ncbi:hypothetical protein Lepto782_11865 [Leptospira interrogans serovar Canicola]|uniref:Uncharacterized protein n=1 Tax=Leptospira interrogans serovar Canicola TaxID=211880 RepID=A0AAP9WCD9_LEPIR|nr:hypothetical protein [Leptospira interrogans]QOI42888.1 hypothetical protein Lepto782_11865 [Leptospira interrogans serovar Canicola]